MADANGLTPEQNAVAEANPGIGFLGTAPNEHGTTTSVHRCSDCGQIFTVCPATDNEHWGTGCQADTCGSYDIARDVDTFFEPLAEYGLITVEPADPPEHP